MLTTSPVPVGILTGFLGAGKTTVLNRFLASPAFAGTAVIVNEFGDVGLDHLLVEAVTGDMLVLTTGCICCAARGDLLAAVEGLMERRAALGFERIVVETTGLADPGPILNALLLGPALAGSVRVGGLVTLVSAVDGDAALDRHAEARHQVALADHLLISKTDMASADAIVHRLAALNPSATIAEARTCGADPRLFDAAPLHAAIVHHHHHHHSSDARIRAGVLEGGCVDADRLTAFVAALQDRCGPSMLRLKGLAALRHAPDRPAVIQAVGHVLHPATTLAGWGELAPRTRLVVILDGVDPAEACSLWDAFFGGPAIDRPDAAALGGSATGGFFA